MTEDDELDIVAELVSEVTELAWTIVRDHLIEEQCFSYACDLTTEKMLQIVEWHYLSRDKGEHNTSQDPSWNEDAGKLFNFKRKSIYFLLSYLRAYPCLY